MAVKVDSVFLQTGFINDRFNKKVNKILKQYSFPISDPQVRRSTGTVTSGLGLVEEKQIR